VIRRERNTWIARCGREEAESRILDVALLEALRAGADVMSHSAGVEYGAWARDQADSIEKELEERD
jgi:hypothetical protein